MKSNRQFLISGRHKRLQRLWQFFFTGWGLVMLLALFAGAVLNKTLLWTPISAINMNDIAKNQFKMENPTFAGLDKDGNPFSIKADSARQEYEDQDKVFMTRVRARIVHVDKGAKITDNIKASHGMYDSVKRSVTLTGDVQVNSSNGDEIRTKEMVIQL
ncbi:MAG: LPS export ABC transporter periplasmic protein LptC [Rickettsiales bacterium]|jgi:hypothetical protein|nr:LPS export ABC transporter periplasmic protein LptC [Rickettsiales bacterium]